MSMFQTGDGLTGPLPGDPNYDGVSGQYDHPDTASITPQNAPPTIPSAVQLLANAPPAPAANVAASSGANTNAPPPAAATASAPAQPNFMQRVQNVAGLPTAPITWQQRIQALARPESRNPPPPSFAAPTPPSLSPPAQRSSTTPQQLHTLLQQFPQFAQTFGMIGAGAPRPGQSRMPPSGGVMQPGGIGGSGPIPAPGTASYGPQL